MLDKYFVQIDKDLFLRFVEAIERIAPPPSGLPTLPAEPSTEEDVISLSDEDWARKDLQWQLDDLVEALTEKGYAEANAEELGQLRDLKARIAEADLGDSEGDRDD